MANEEKNIASRKYINKEFDIDIFTNTLKKNWRWIPIIVVVLVALSFIYLRYTKPVFEAKTVIQLENIDEGKKIIDIESITNQNGGDELQSDVELLKSELILRGSLKRLKLNVSYFSKGNILTEEKYKYSSYQVLPISISDSSIMGANIRILIEEDEIILKYNHKGKREDRFKIGETYENDLFKIIINVNNLELFKQNIDENELYFIFNDFKSLAKEYIGNLNVKVLSPEAKSIEIKYRSNNPLLSRDIVEAIVQTFFEHDLYKKQKGSANILDFIERQLDSISDQLKVSENKIQKFKTVNRVQDPQGISASLLTRITTLEGQLVEHELEDKLLQTINEVIIQNPDRLEVYNLLPGIVGSQFESSLTNQITILHELLLLKEDASFSSTEKNSAVKNLNFKITAQVKTIKRILGAFQTKLKIQKEAIEEKIAEIESNFYALPEKEIELSRLERFFQLNEKYYVLLLEKKAQYSISKEGFTTSNLILSEVVTPSSPISPRKNLIIIGSIILGIIIGSLFLFFKYLFYNEINDPEELRKLLHEKVGFLGFVPTHKTEKKYSVPVVFENPKSHVAESFRTLRANLNFITEEKEKIVMGVTSTIPGEGKTFVTLNLGAIYALSSKKTVIIDMDMRKPKIHVGLEMKNKYGISDVLSGAKSVKDVVVKSDQQNLHIITSGTIPPNPNELILNGKMNKIIEDLKNEFDVIIIDNPPVGIVSDGIEIMKKVDIPIFIVRANYSKRYFTNNISSYLTEKKLNNVYTILNGFHTKKKDYGYSYGYGNYYHEPVNTKKSIFAKILKRK